MRLDIYRYSGAINNNGHSALCKHLVKRNREDEARALLLIGTPGGLPNEGFRIARALQHAYPSGFEALVPRYCKSAGTLVLVGASKIYMADQSELGPLDIQMKKGDELTGRSSGLDINAAIDFLSEHALTSFYGYMHRLVSQGLSTKVAADIAVRLAQGIVNPIAAQIEPLRLAEMQRATRITFAYGQRLAEGGKNMKKDGLETLIAAYPSHGFVIDRKEARTIFNCVESPTDWMEPLCYDFQERFGRRVSDSVPVVERETIEIPSNPEGVNSDTSCADRGGAEASPPADQRPVDGSGAENGSRKASKSTRSRRAGAR